MRSVGSNFKLPIHWVISFGAPISIILSTLSCMGFVGMALSHFIKCLITKNTTSLSRYFVILLPITNTLLTIYDIALFSLFYINTSYGLAWSMLMPIVFNGLISAYGVMILKLKHIYQAKKLGMTEEEHYLKYLKPRAWNSKKQTNQENPIKI